MILLVCGGRDYADRARLFYMLDMRDAGTPITLLVHGACPSGADQFADEWAIERGVPRLAFPADWQHGKAAGPIRNAQMLRETQPDLVMAFEGGRGTKNMIDQARRAGLTIVTVAE